MKVSELLAKVHGLGEFPYTFKLEAYYHAVLNREVWDLKLVSDDIHFRFLPRDQEGSFVLSRSVDMLPSGEAAEDFFKSLESTLGFKVVPKEDPIFSQAEKIWDEAKGAFSRFFQKLDKVGENEDSADPELILTAYLVKDPEGYPPIYLQGTISHYGVYDFSVSARDFVGLGESISAILEGLMKRLDDRLLEKFYEDCIDGTEWTGEVRAEMVKPDLIHIVVPAYTWNHKSQRIMEELPLWKEWFSQHGWTGELLLEVVGLGDWTW